MSCIVRSLHSSVLQLSGRFGAKLSCGSLNRCLASTRPPSSRSSRRHTFLRDTDEVSLSCGSVVRVDSLGYRPNVAVVVFNQDGNVLTCRRFFKERRSVNERGDGSNWVENWQFPQGGIDEGEDPLPAAFRELAEETSITDVELVAEYPGWLTYDFDARTKAKLGARMDQYRGQKQKYFLMKFTGDDADIMLDVPGHSKEFDAFEWVRCEDAAGRVVAFKQDVYAQVAEEFAPIIEKAVSLGSHK